MKNIHHRDTESTEKKFFVIGSPRKSLCASVVNPR
jgi:hypothetical protein